MLLTVLLRGLLAVLLLLGLLSVLLLLGLLAVLLLLGLLSILLRGLLLLLAISLGRLTVLLLLLGRSVMLLLRSVLRLLTVLLRGLAILLLRLAVALGTTLHRHTEDVHSHCLVVLWWLLLLLLIHLGLLLAVNGGELRGLMSSHNGTENVGSLASVCGRGFPVTLQVNSTTLLTLVLKIEPLVHATVHAEARNLHNNGADQVTCGHILVHDFDVNIVTDVLDVNVDGLVPLRKLTGALEHLGLEILVACHNLAEGVHLRKHFCVTC